MANLDVKCPLCGAMVCYKVDNGNMWGTHVMCCDDPAHGGCGDYFAISWSFTPKVETFILKKSDES
jgi:hypothetical protein